jgi:hypothetical protein
VISSEFFKRPYLWPTQQNRENYQYPLQLAERR